MTLRYSQTLQVEILLQSLWQNSEIGIKRTEMELRPMDKECNQVENKREGLKEKFLYSSNKQASPSSSSARTLYFPRLFATLSVGTSFILANFSVARRKNGFNIKLFDVVEARSARTLEFFVVERRHKVCLKCSVVCTNKTGMIMQFGWRTYACRKQQFLMH